MVVVGAAAKITCQSGAHIVRIRVCIPREQSFGAHQLTRRTESTLRPIMFDECLLQWIEPSVLRETLDRLHGSAIGPHGQIAARVDRLAVQQDCAGTALAPVTTDLCPGHAEVSAKNFNQCPAIFDLDAARGAVPRYTYRFSWNRLGCWDRYRILGFDGWCGRNRKRRAGSLQKSAA